SADRPFTESERGFLEGIRAWGKKVVVVVNKVDILERPEEVETVRGFIAEHARVLLGFTPEIFLVSARRALRAKEKDDAAGLAESGFDKLEATLVKTLDERERVKLKLQNPLGVGLHVTERYLEVSNGRLELLRDDVKTLEDVERQLTVYREDMAREFRFRLSDVDTVLHQFEARGIEYFDDTLRLARVVDLLQKERIKAEFAKKVVGDAPQLIEQRVSEVIDWLVSSDLRQWQAVMEHLAKRRHAHADRIVGQVGGSFDLDRGRLLEGVGREAQRSIDSYDRNAEAQRLADSVQAAVAGTALLQVGAIGLGAVITHVAVTAAADWTGILAASTLAVLGLLILPNRRRQAKEELHVKITALRTELMDNLTGQFDRELDRSVRRIDEAIAPYTRFVRAERTQLAESQTELNSLRDSLTALRARIEAL
ncbi:MAG TPA: dynamin, partial [Thermoanaerobaculia bacterium]|nr:dynamin [Thermoanaerobaculia bacterium]